MRIEALMAKIKISSFLDVMPRNLVDYQHFVWTYCITAYVSWNIGKDYIIP
jgi:hypothetical protein